MLTQSIIDAGEKLSHVRSLIAGAARHIAEQCRVLGAPSETTLEDLRQYLAAENAAKLELALALELSKGE